MDNHPWVKMKQGRSPPVAYSEKETQNEALEFELGLGPEDEAALLEEADRTYREWMRIIGERSPD